MRDFFKYRCKRGENNEAWIISFFLERDGIFAVFAAFNLSASFIGINHWLFWDQASTYLILESLIYKKLDQERYITREECIEWCGNSWLPSIDDSVAIKKKNYTGRFFHDKFSETVMVSTRSSVFSDFWARKPFEELQTYHARVGFDFNEEKWYEENLLFGRTEVHISSWSQDESNSSLGFVRDQTLPDPSNRLVYPILNDRIGRVSMYWKV